MNKKLMLGMFLAILSLEFNVLAMKHEGDKLVEREPKRQHLDDETRARKEIDKLLGEYDPVLFANFGEFTNDLSKQLMLAAYDGNLFVVEFILDNIERIPEISQDTLMPTSWGLTALHFAAARGHVVIGQKLLESDYNEHFLSSGYFFVGDTWMDNFCEAGRVAGWNALHFAIYHNQLLFAFMLLESRFAQNLVVGKFDLIEGEERTTHSNAIFRLAFRFAMNAVITKALEISGGSTMDDNTALHFAAFYGNNEIVHLEFQKDFAKRNTNLRDYFDMNPLHVAYYKGHIDTAEIILGYQPEMADEIYVGHWKHMDFDTRENSLP